MTACIVVPGKKASRKIQIKAINTGKQNNVTNSVAVGNLVKMPASLDSSNESGKNTAVYHLALDDERFSLNEHIGKKIALRFLGEIHCVYCGRKTNKSFNQGYCFPCFRKLAQCDTCIVKPETCHYDQGTCREPDWAQTHCFTDHMVYLANTSGLKVGITRMSQIPTRWIDQGAIQAIPLIRVSDRKLSGQVESHLAEEMADKTSWQAMLKDLTDPMDMHAERAQAIEKALNYIQNHLQLTDLTKYSAQDSEVIDISYPVLEYPTKVVSLNFDKTPLVEGTLMGIKGQYLMFDTGVINIRKFGGYKVEFFNQ